VSLEIVTVREEFIPPGKVVRRITHTFSACPSVTFIIGLGKLIVTSVEKVTINIINPDSAMIYGCH